MVRVMDTETYVWAIEDRIVEIESSRFYNEHMSKEVEVLLSRIDTIRTGKPGYKGTSVSKEDIEEWERKKTK